MNFFKGTLIGIIAGTCIGVMNNEMINDAFNISKKKLRRLQRKMGI